ncbi:MAG: DUF4825 domain-containing protein [Lachnospiraceae bacterium]
MMKNKIPCEVIRDLLPSYIDGLTSDITNAEIKTHMKECASCKDVLDAMKNPDAEPVDNANTEEIDFLRKTRRKVKNTVLGIVLAAVLGIVVVTAVRFMMIGHDINSDYIVYDMEVDGCRLSIQGRTTSDSGIRKVEIAEAGGIVRIDFKGVDSSLIYSSSFEKEYTASEPISEIVIGNRVVWSDGEVISPITSAVFQTGHAYAGDMPANGQTASALNIDGFLGNFTSELRTTGEPYGWKITPENSFSADRREVVEERMKSYAYVILAVIDNLGEVTFEYEIDGEVYELTVNTDDATSYAGEEIKSVGKDINRLQRLMEQTGLAM